MIEKASKSRSDPALSFEEFSSRGADGITPRYVNFNAYFGNGVAGDIYRDTPQFRALKEKNPGLADALCSEVTAALSDGFGAHEGTYAKLAAQEPKMYLAYLAMKQEGFSDAELFC